MKETIGLLMMSGNITSDAESKGGATYTLGFLPVMPTTGTKVEPLSAKEAETMRLMGFGPVAVIKTEIIRHGTEITYTDGYECYFVEGLPAELRGQVQLLTMTRRIEVMVDDFLAQFLDKLHASTDRSQEA